MNMRNRSTQGLVSISTCKILNKSKGCTNMSRLGNKSSHLKLCVQPNLLKYLINMHQTHHVGQQEVQQGAHEIFLKLNEVLQNFFEGSQEKLCLRFSITITNECLLVDFGLGSIHNIDFKKQMHLKVLFQMLDLMKNLECLGKEKTF